MRQRLKLQNKLYFMFIGDLEAEIQAIVLRSWKMSWSSPVYFPHYSALHSSVYKSMGKAGPSDFWTTLENEVYLDF